MSEERRLFGNREQYLLQDWSDQEIMNSEKEGRVIQIIGPVVDIKFQPDELPDIYNAVRIVNEDAKSVQSVAGRQKRHGVEVMQHLEMMLSVVLLCLTDLTGHEGCGYGRSYAVPVGQNTLGRIFNVLVEH